MRASGVLLPITSLPSKYGIGCFSKEAYEFVDFLAEAKQKYWQILPIGPTSYGDSPYQSFSTYAGNPYFIDLEALISEGLLTIEECESVDFGSDATKVDYEKIYFGRFPLLKKAYKRSNISDKKEFVNFCEEQKAWLVDYATYMAIKDSFGGKSYTLWPEDIRRHEPEAVERYTNELEDEIIFYEFLQYYFFKQWEKLKSYANEKGILIIGDIPIYVSPDGADIWAQPELFQMENGEQAALAGCPPDSFSADGQLWGNPVYDWDYHKKTNYAWWISRIAHCTKLYDVIRIDHFRGFDQYYSIPMGSKNARNGEWLDGPGYELFAMIKQELGEVSIIAEDLGFMTDTVRKLVADTKFPNMKILQFAFDPKDKKGLNDHLPKNYSKNCVVYTGTHDNETLMGWLGEITFWDKRPVRKYLKAPFANNEKICKGLIRLAYESVADYCIIPLQDYLLLGNEARINTPSTTGGNWQWRFRQEQIPSHLASDMAEMVELYGR